MPGKFGYTFLDRSGETSRVDLNCADLTAGNIASTLATALPATAGGLGEAIAAVTLCTPASVDVLAAKTPLSQEVPVSNYAQREIGLMISYTDDVTHQSYRVTIPGPDWATLGQANSDQVNPAVGAWTTLVTAIEAHCVSPVGNAITVTGGRLVGRNR